MSIKKNSKKIAKFLGKLPAEVSIFILAVAYRLPTLGYDFINSDAYHWKQRGYEFGGALVSFDFAKTAVTYHPGVPLLWNQFIAGKMFSIADAFYYKGSLSGNELFLVNHFWQKFILVIITSFLISLVFNLVKPYIGEKLSIIAVGLILLEPFYIGLSRAIHTDALLSLFMFLSFLCFLEYIKQEGYDIRGGAISGLFAGLAMLTKSAGIFIILFFVLIALYHYKIRRYDAGLMFKKTFTALAISILTFIVIWPAMWVSPITSIQSYIVEGIGGIGLQDGHGHI